MVWQGPNFLCGSSGLIVTVTARAAVASSPVSLCLESDPSVFEYY